MRLLLVNCIELFGGKRYIDEMAEHLGIFYLSSSLKRHFSGKELEIKFTYGPISDSVLNEVKPDIVGLSAISQDYKIAKRYARACKEKCLPVIIGGVHISVLPNTMTKDMDIGVIYEGEQTIVELIRLFMEEKGFPKDKLREIKGIVFHENGGIARTAPRELIKDLDTIAMPDRDLYLHPRRGILTSRGCPYDCVFCFSKPFWGKKVRFFSPEYVINELKKIVGKYKVSQIYIYDDLFTANKQRFKKIVQYIRESGLHKKVSFNCNVRANEVTEEVADLLRSMNCTYVLLGLESGNQRILKFLKKQACTVEMNYDAVRILKKRGIIVEGGFIIGSPDETKEEIMDTYRFIRKSKIDLVSPFILAPLPGTQVWEIAKQRGLVCEDEMDWDAVNVSVDKKGIPPWRILVSETLTREKLSHLYAKFNRLRERLIIYYILKHPFASMRASRGFIKRQLHKIKFFFKTRET